MDKKPLVGVSIIAVVLLILGSLSNVVGFQTVQSSNQKVINDEVDPKELLFQTIVDISNNKEIQRIILKSQMLNGKFLDSDIKLPTTNTKQQLKRMYFIGLILSKFISKSRIHSMITQSQLMNPEMQKEISTIIEKDAILTREVSQLHILGCNCNEGDSARLWHFPIICTLLIPLALVGAFLLLGGVRWDAYLSYTIGVLILVSIGKISEILQCFPWAPHPPPNNFPWFSDISPADGEQNVSLSLTEISFRIYDDEGDLMSYKVTTNPDIGEGSATLIPNGTYTIPIHGLHNSTTYTWKFYLYEGDNSGTPIGKTFTFTTAPLAPFIWNPSPRHNAQYVPIYWSNVSFDLKDFQQDLLNWTVETQPDIGSGGANGVGDGRYTVAITGLEYDTKYTWFLNTTDGTYWTRKTYVFTTTSEGLLVLEPIADTYVDDDSPDRNNGHYDRIFLSYKDSSIPSCWDARGLILFDLSGIPAGSMIHSANLSLYYFEYNNINPVGREITCHRILENWDEMTVTFNTMPDSNSVECANTTVPANFTWVDWNVTLEVNAFVNGGVQNHGWMIRDDKDPVWQYCHHYYYSSNAGDRLPRLFVWFNSS
jgi:hypothetical protein